MEAAEESTGSGRRTEQRWHMGCLVTLLALSGLGVLGLWGLAELEKGLDGYGQLEGTPGGSSGSVTDPLTPGVTAQYEDGLRVTVSEPRQEPGGRAYRFTVTYENGTDKTLNPGAGFTEETVSEYEGAPLVVRAGKPLDDAGPDDGSSCDWLNGEQAARKLKSSLSSGGSVAVPVRVAGDRAGMPVTVEVTPPDDGSRETAYWKLTLDRRLDRRLS